MARGVLQYLMFWSNVSEKGPKNSLKVYYTFITEWKHPFLIFYVVLKSKVSDILKFWEPRCNRVILLLLLYSSDIALYNVATCSKHFTMCTNLLWYWSTQSNSFSCICNPAAFIWRTFTRPCSQRNQKPETWIAPYSLQEISRVLYPAHDLSVDERWKGYM